MNVYDVELGCSRFSEDPNNDDRFPAIFVIKTLRTALVTLSLRQAKNITDAFQEPKNDRHITVRMTAEQLGNLTALLSDDQGSKSLRGDPLSNIFWVTKIVKVEGSPLDITPPPIKDCPATEPGPESIGALLRQHTKQSRAWE